MFLFSKLFHKDDKKKEMVDAVAVFRLEVEKLSCKAK